MEVSLHTCSVFGLSFGEWLATYRECLSETAALLTEQCVTAYICNIPASLGANNTSAAYYGVTQIPSLYTFAGRSDQLRNPGGRARSSRARLAGKRV